MGEKDGGERCETLLAGSQKLNHVARGYILKIEIVCVEIYYDNKYSDYLNYLIRIFSSQYQMYI